MKQPIYVHYFDSDTFAIYNLTKDQYDHLSAKGDDDYETRDKFLVDTDRVYAEGYISDEMKVLADLLGFEVGTD